MEAFYDGLMLAELVNRTRHCHYHFAGVETEQKFLSTKGTPQEQQALSVVIGFLRQLRQLAIAVDDIGISTAVQHSLQDTACPSE